MGDSAIDLMNEQRARELAPCRCGVGEFSEPGRDPRVHASQCPVQLRAAIAAAFARAEARLAEAEHERDEARRLHRQSFYLACARVTLARRTRERDEARAGTPMMRLAAEVREINKANGWLVLHRSEWEDPYKIPGILALIHSEVSEALEAFRVADEAHFAEELADVVIRVLDCAIGLGIDLDAAVRAKMDKNRTRGYRHGGKRV